VETVTYEARDGVGWVTLNRPDVMNAFDARMLDELSALWRQLRTDDDVRVIVLTGAGDRAFCTGLDRGGIVGDGTAEGGIGFTSSPFHQDDPGARLGPKTNDLWKPVIGAVNGIACGGAFYLLGECDILIAAEEATFFDPHVTYGMPATYESILLVGRMPLGEVLRMQLTGADERLSAKRAYEVGLVSEVVPRAGLHAAAESHSTRVTRSPGSAPTSSCFAKAKAGSAPANAGNGASASPRRTLKITRTL
jgi:enoyl-CoA hydratase/carnithine racemase